jgi:hypothetical protein
MSLIEQRHSPGEQLNGIVARPESDARDLAIASELRPNKPRSITSALSQKRSFRIRRLDHLCLRDPINKYSLCELNAAGWSRRGYSCLVSVPTRRALLLFENWGAADYLLSSP